MTSNRDDDLAARVKAVTDIQAVISRHVKLDRVGDLYIGLCPFHDDKHNPNFKVYINGGNPHYHCYACDANGDVFDFLTKTQNRSFADVLAELAMQAGIPTHSDHETVKRKIRYSYTADDGLTYVKVRNEYADGHKDFDWYTQAGYKRGAKGLNGIRIRQMMLYHSSDIAESDPSCPVIFAEGEKAADALVERGFLAVSAAGGAAQKEFDNSLDILAGHPVFLWPDNDNQGHTFMKRVGRKLDGVASEVRWLALTHSGIKEKDDAFDYFASGHTQNNVQLAMLIAPHLESHTETETPEAEKVSAHIENEVWAETKFKVWTAKEIGEATVAEVPWLAYPWLVAGCLTEVDGKIKASGKTTWVTHLCRAILSGNSFMGYPTEQGGVMYLTEQPVASFRQALARADLLERDDFAVVFWHDTSTMSWPEIVEQASREAHRREAKVLVVDVLSRFAKIAGDAENNAGSAGEAMTPLKVAAALYNLSIILVRHDRKGGGEVGESGRGSSAYSGEVDIVLNIRRPEGNAAPNVRMIHALSRFDGTPDKLAIELTEQGYISLGSEDDYAVERAKVTLLESLPTQEENALKLDELVSMTKEPRSTLQRATSELVLNGKVQTTGKGKRGSPFAFWRSLAEAA